MRRPNRAGDDTAVLATSSAGGLDFDCTLKGCTLDDEELSFGRHRLGHSRRKG